MFNSTMILMKKYVPKEERIKIYKAVLLAQDIQEESWNGKSYDKNEFQSAKEACEQIGLDEELSFVICRWNSFVWNDIQSFAEAFLKVGV